MRLRQIMVREISTLMVWDRVVPSAAPAGPSFSKPMKIIQGNIKSTGNRNEKHRTFRVSYAAENGADDVVGCDKRDAEKTDGQVGDGATDCFHWGGHDSHDGFYKTEQDCGQGNGQQHE